jgi:hypothetical protein
MQTSFQPWLDFEHRRYWIAEKGSNIVGILVLTSVHHNQYQIKNAVSFPNAPRGTSETTIYRVMSDIQDEGVISSDEESDRKSEDGTLVWTKTDLEVARKIGEDASQSRSRSVDSSRSDSPSGSDSGSSFSGKSTTSSSSSHGTQRGGVAVTFGITASDSLTPVDNLSGWKITWLSKTYNRVIGLTGLTRRGDFRVRFPCFHFSHALVF